MLADYKSIKASCTIQCALVYWRGLVTLPKTHVPLIKDMKNTGNIPISIYLYLCLYLYLYIDISVSFRVQ